MGALLRNALLTLGLVGLFSGLGSDTKADEWGRHYHWPYGVQSQYYWSPYEYQRVYDGRYRYPASQRVYRQQGHYRNWLAVPKPYYKGYHFILDQL